MYKILIIDDEPEIAEVFKRAFENEEFEVDVARDGKQGIIEVKQNKPDFILLDIMMPKMDGVAVFKSLIADKETREIPVGLYSALDQDIKSFLGGKDAETLQKAFAFWEKDKTSPLQIVDEVRKRLNISEGRRS